MLDLHQFEDLICAVAVLDRDALVQQFQAYPSTFPIDFTSEFLQTVPLDRLRHIFLALCMQCQHVPELMLQSAA
jgi:hypothetical protein